jgi:hypothetical protein
MAPLGVMSDTALGLVWVEEDSRDTQKGLGEEVLADDDKEPEERGRACFDN